jgi:hypothetical protein
VAFTAAISAPANEAQATALRCFSANLRALIQSQPNLIAAVRRPEGEYAWIYGRDGSLTALTPDGQWLADCSLPYRAACAMLKSVETRGGVSCLLAPVHAALVRRTLELLSPQQALLVLSPDETFLAVALHCHDFSTEIEAHRLFFAVGPGWAAQLTDLFREHPGLPIPNLFLRPPTTPDLVAHPLIETAQRLFNETNAARNAALAELAGRPAPRLKGSPRRVCAVAPAVFRLWSDAPALLADVLSPHIEVRRLDPERPTTSSHLALATAVRDCDALVTANLARADVPPQIVPDTLPWVTWATTPAIPDGRRAAAQDRLIVADPAWLPPAIAAGWQKSQLSVAAWPAPELPRPASPPAGLALIADTEPLRTDIDEETFEFSCHMVLWELIASELHANPLLAAEDPDAYLTSRMNRLSIGPDGFNRAIFLNTLVTPAYQQGLARVLLAARLPLRLFGRGWRDRPEFAPHAAGPITSRPDLLCAASSAAALVRATPGAFPHAITTLGRPVVTPVAGPPAAFLSSATSALSGRTPQSRATAPTLTADLVLALLRRPSA